MGVFRLALRAGAGTCVLVSASSWSAGYPPELAITRGVAAFVAMALLGFVGQLIVSRGRVPRAAREPAGMATDRSGSPSEELSAST